MHLIKMSPMSICYLTTSWYKFGIALLILSLFNCRSVEKNDEVIFDGRKVESIQNDVIFFSDGAKLELNSDTIAAVYFLIRHAEKDTTKEELPLSEEGLERSYRLADIFKSSRLDAIYTTLMSRSIQTIDSVAQMKALPYKPYLHQKMKERFSEMMKRPDEKRVLIVGHSNTIPAICNFLAGREVFNRAFEENEYDKFIVVLRGKGGTSIVYKLKY